MKHEDKENKVRDKALDSIVDVVSSESVNIYPCCEMEDGIRPRDTPDDLAGGEFSTYPANCCGCGCGCGGEDAKNKDEKKGYRLPPPRR